MAPIPLVLMVFAFVCFVLAAFPVSEPYRPRLVPAGLAFWSLTIILGYAGVFGNDMLLVLIVLLLLFSGGGFYYGGLQLGGGLGLILVVVIIIVLLRGRGGDL